MQVESKSCKLVQTNTNETLTTLASGPLDRHSELPAHSGEASEDNCTCLVPCNVKRPTRSQLASQRGAQLTARAEQTSELPGKRPAKRDPKDMLETSEDELERCERF